MFEAFNYTHPLSHHSHTRTTHSHRTLRFLYDLDTPIKTKIETIAREIYGADGCDFSPKANEQIEAYTAAGYDDLPICMAKTQVSCQPEINI